MTSGQDRDRTAGEAGGSMPGEPTTDEVAAVEARIAGELARLTRPRRVAGRVLPPPPYVRRHAVEHAAAGHVLDEGFLSAEFLPYVDAARLRPLAVGGMNAAAGRRPGSPAVPSLVEMWRKAAHAWSWESPAANADALAFWAVASGRPEAVETAAGLWRTRWADWRVGGGEILGRHAGGVEAVATATLPDGRVVAVTGSEDATLPVWDLRTSRPTTRPLTGHTSTVDAVATATLSDGRVIAVTGNSVDAAVRVWDLLTGTPIGEPLTGHTGPVRAVATTTLPDGRAVAVTGSEDATLPVWDLRTGRPTTRPLTGHTSTVDAVATATLSDGRVIAVTGSHDATVRVWVRVRVRVRDLLAGTPIDEPLTDDTGLMWAVATATLPDGRTVAVTVSDAHTVRVWDLLTGTPTSQPLTGHTSTVWAVATATLPDGQVVAVTGSRDATVRVWDLLTGTPTSQPLTGHTSTVWAVATATLPDGRVVTVTGSDDATVRVWDLATGHEVGHPLHVPGSVHALDVHQDEEVTVIVAGDGVACVDLQVEFI